MKSFLLLSFTLLGISAAARHSTVLKTDTSLKKDTTHTLKEVTVSSKYYKHYKHDKTSNTLKVNHPLLTFPQNIQVVDQSIIADQQAININESVVRNVSGAFRNNTADYYSSLIYMRGASINPLRNGLDLSTIYYNPMPEDAALIDRGEFIKGPAGFINSVGDAAGSYNVLTKQPDSMRFNQVAFTTGSFNLYRLTGDFAGTAGKTRQWEYRLNVAGQKSKSFQRYAFNDKLVADPVLRYNINSHSSVTSEYIYQAQSFEQYLLTVFSPYGFASLPRDFSIVDPNKKPVHANEHNAFLTYFNQLNSKWQFTAKGGYLRDHVDGNYFFVSSYKVNAPAALQRRVTYERFNTDALALQAFLNGEINTGKLTHKLLISADFNDKNLLAYSGYNDKTANPALYPLDVNNPIYGISFDANERSGKLDDIATNQSYIRYYAAYLQDELNLLNDRLRVTIAARLTGANSTVKLPAASSVKNTVVTPRIGLSYSLLSTMAVYALFDNTFTPQSGISAAGGAFLPLRGRNIEAGIKKDWLGGKWNTTVSVYTINRRNSIVTDPATLLQSQLGKTRSKGIEFDLKGEVVKGLNAVINYAYTDSYITKDANQALVGLPTPYRIKHLQNTWLNYRLPLQRLHGFSVSGGYQLQAGRYGRYPQETNVRPAPVFRLDGGIGWTNGRLAVNGIVNNILNRFNYGSAWITPVAANPTTGDYAYVPYPPREFRATVACSF
ncbi:TonB-dependent siderophore receptor [Mucilaginibacter sp.]